MKRGQKITIIVSLCVLSGIVIPIYIGAKIPVPEDTAPAVEPSPKVTLPEKKDDKIWEGFRGTKFGWTITREDRPPDGEWAQQEKSGDMELYMKWADNETVGHQKVDISWVFYKKQLMGIAVIATGGEAAFAEISKNIFIYYGEPQQQKDDENNNSYWAWPKTITNGKVWALLTYDGDTTNFQIWYVPLAELREKEEKEAAASGRDF